MLARTLATAVALTVLSAASSASAAPNLVTTFTGPSFEPMGSQPLTRLNASLSATWLILRLAHRW